MLKLPLLCAVAVSALLATDAAAQTYTYLTEGFEEAAWATKQATVTSATGTWTSNKNVADAEHHEGAKSLLFSEKVGLTSPELAEGCGMVIWYDKVQNRKLKVEVFDGTTWTAIRDDAKAVTADWGKHTLAVNDANVRQVRWSIPSNGQFYIDDVLITKPDGTDGAGQQVVVTQRLPYFTATFEGEGALLGSAGDNTAPKSVELASGTWTIDHAGKEVTAANLPNGSSTGVRVTKNGGYIITPELSQGVAEVTFREGRGKQVSVYVSADASQWTLAAQFETVTTDLISVSVQEPAVKWVKIMSESSNDLSLDDISVTAFPQGTPATLTTGEATEIGPASASIAGSIGDAGDRPLCYAQVEYATTPGLDGKGRRADATIDGTTMTAKLAELPANTTIYYRCLLATLAGVSYGAERSFTTLSATLPTVTLRYPRPFADANAAGLVGVRLAMTLDGNGGDQVTRLGVCYGTQPEPNGANGMMLLGNPALDSNSGVVQLLPATKYYFRAFATNGVGTAISADCEWTTPAAPAKQYDKHVYWCAPDGNDDTADGSEAKPYYSLATVAKLVGPGDVINMKAGTYNYDTRIKLDAIGEPGDGMITLQCPDEGATKRAVLNFHDMADDDFNQGIWLAGSYWHIFKIDIVEAGDNGMIVEKTKPDGGTYNDIKDNTTEAHDNIIEFCRFYRNRDTGLQMKNLANRNRVINCDAFYNIDSKQGDADGFAVKLSHGTDNYFYGCRAWNNSDDGWDQFIKTDGGFPDDQWTTLELCQAWRNGYNEADVVLAGGNGNGIKMGSDQGRNNVICNRCLAYENKSKSFDQNHNTGSMLLRNCTGWAKHNGKSKGFPLSFSFAEPVANGKVISLVNCLALGGEGDDNMASKNPEYAVHDIGAAASRPPATSRRSPRTSRACSSSR